MAALPLTLRDKPDLAAAEPAPHFWVKRARSGHGEFSSNLALVLAARQKRAASEIARELCAVLKWPGEVEEAGGFLNFRLDDQSLKNEVTRAVTEGARYGAGGSLAGQRFLVEFVSADPTGPLPFALGRIAAAGDALCRVLNFQGADVTREFYLNDVESSSKMRLLGESVAAAYARHFGREVELPEGALSDKFIQRIAGDIAENEGTAFLLVPEAERNAKFAHSAREAAVASQKDTLKEFGVRFDVWTSEAALRNEGRVESVLRKLAERGESYENNGATWLRTTKYGDLSDRVLVRENGEPTYLASDIAYHVFKFERGFDVVFNIWTGEHREYIERTRAALTAAGCDAARLEVVACEGARWLVDDKPVARGREGGAFSLNEALQELEHGTLRFLLLRADWDSVVTIDAEQAQRDDESNPGYAARLLPSRLATLIREAEANPAADAADSDAVAGDAVDWNAEGQAIARLVALWPETAQSAAAERAPHKVAEYVGELASAVRAGLKVARPGSLSANGLEVLRAAHVVAVNALGVLGIEASDKF